MIDYKIVIGFAAFAFIVSLLSGLIGGVSFGILTLRTLLGTAFFAALGAGASWIFKRYLPEIFSRAEAGETVEEPASAVDIVLPEENPHEDGGYEQGREDAGGERVDIGAEDPSVDQAEEEALASAELEELESVEPEALAGAEPMEPEAPDRPKPMETAAEPAVSLEDPPSAGVETVSEDDEGIDTMPLLDGIEGVDTPIPKAEKTTRGAPVDVMGSTHDPAEAAKAIKTWMKRDEKG